jgi:hypothetical protein
MMAYIDLFVQVQVVVFQVGLPSKHCSILCFQFVVNRFGLLLLRVSVIHSLSTAQTEMYSVLLVWDADRKLDLLERALFGHCVKRASSTAWTDQA